LKKELTDFLEKAKRDRDDVIQKTLRDRDDVILKFQGEMDKLTKERVAAEIEAKSLRNRNEQLLRQVEDLTKKLAALRQASARIPPRKNAPPKDLEGIILKVTDDLVDISIGSDSGLEKGHTLEVYRLKPVPQYIGQIRIVEVRANEAVGKFVEK